MKRLSFKRSGLAGAPLGLSVLAATALIGAVPNASAAASPNCQLGQAPEFVLGFAALQQSVGQAMGDPIECEHANPANGDTLQQTTTGLAFYRKATNTSTFTNGSEHWGLTSSGLVFWTGSSIDPPGSVVAPSEPAAPPVPVAAVPVAPLVTPAPVSPSQPPAPSHPLVSPSQTLVPAPPSISSLTEASVLQLVASVPVPTDTGLPGSPRVTLSDSTDASSLSFLNVSL